MGHKAISGLISMYTVCSLNHQSFLTPPLDTCCISLVDLVRLAWKHRMKHAKLGSKEAHLSAEAEADTKTHAVHRKPGWPHGYCN